MTDGQKCEWHDSDCQGEVAVSAAVEQHAVPICARCLAKLSRVRGKAGYAVAPPVDGAVEVEMHPIGLSEAIDRIEARKAAASESGTAIATECDAIKSMLLAKNAAYGDSALSPLRVFSKADSVEQLKVRIDDKLSRLARGSEANEDTVLDLIGYLVLLRVAQKRT